MPKRTIVHPVVLVVTEMGEEVIGIVIEIDGDHIYVERDPNFAIPCQWYSIHHVTALIGEL